MRKYVWFSEHTHNNRIGDTTIVNAMTYQVEELVMKGWYGSSRLIAASVDLLATTVVVYFMGWQALVPLAVLFPLSLLIFHVRSPKMIALLEARVSLERAWLGIMGDAMDNWPLINAYGLRDEVAEDFKKTCKRRPVPTFLH